MKDNWYLNNLAKIKIYAVIHSRIIQKSVLPWFIYRALYEDAMLVGTNMAAVK